MFSSLIRSGSRRARLYLIVPLVLLAINSLAVIYGPRLLAWRFQQPMRQYRNLDNDIARLNVAGQTVLGSAPEWYAVERLGGHFEIPSFEFVKPDASKQDYVIVHNNDAAATALALDGFSRAGEIGTTFPRVFGSKLADQDYRLIVYRSNILKPANVSAAVEP